MTPKMTNTPVAPHLGNLISPIIDDFFLQTSMKGIHKALVKRATCSTDEVCGTSAPS